MEQSDRLNSVKKYLYKNKPLADFTHVNKSGIAYILIEDVEHICSFFIPFNDIGDAVFTPQMPSQQLIRWIILPPTNA